MEDFESQSWQDRCDRYFTSISDTGKDRDQEKHTRNDSENSREKHESGYADDNYKIWKDLSEVRKKVSEPWLLRRARETLSALDVHGARVASKTKGAAGFTLWVVVVLISVVTFGVLFFIVMKEFLKQTSEYRTQNMTSYKLDSSDISVTVCNLNLITKSKLDLANSELSDLKSFLDGTNIELKRREAKTVKEEINSNAELKSVLQNRVSDTFSDFLADIENDVIARELMTSSDISLLYRLSNYGKPELLTEVAGISKPILEEMGHGLNETLVQCWIGNRQCKKKEIQMLTDPVHGNCITVSTRSNSRTIDLVLDAQSGEYIHQLSPSVGFKVFISDNPQTVHGQWMIISPGLHGGISVDKLTTIKRLDSSCNPSVVSKKMCENRCLNQHIVNICGCSLHGEDPDLKLCEMDQASDYVCVKSLQLLQLEGNLPCQCKESCRENKFNVQITMVEWPSKQNMVQFVQTILPGLKNVTSDYIRENIAKLTIHLEPMTYEEIQEYESNKILDLLVRIGGISALVAGVSVVTVLEIGFMILQCAVHLVRRIRRRSDDIASPRRLSDSEITSITWAMYKQRRRFEEVNKMKLANNTTVNLLGGNAQTRILKRNSYATPENKEANGDLAYNPMPGSHESPARQNYLRRYDGKNPSYPKNRDSLTKEKSHSSDKATGDVNNKYRNNGGGYKVNVIRPHHQMDYTYDNRQVPVYAGNVLQPHGLQYVDNNAVERYRSDNVFFYDGAAAYYNAAAVSEPVYL